jgi:hypothetical protein
MLERKRNQEKKYYHVRRLHITSVVFFPDENRSKLYTKEFGVGDDGLRRVWSGKLSRGFARAARARRFAFGVL